eukprot:RCo005295
MARRRRAIIGLRQRKKPCPLLGSRGVIFISLRILRDKLEVDCKKSVLPPSPSFHFHFFPCVFVFCLDSWLAISSSMKGAEEGLGSVCSVAANLDPHNWLPVLFLSLHGAGNSRLRCAFVSFYTFFPLVLAAQQSCCCNVFAL